MRQRNRASDVILLSLGQTQVLQQKEKWKAISVGMNCGEKSSNMKNLNFHWLWRQLGKWLLPTSFSHCACYHSRPSATELPLQNQDSWLSLVTKASIKTAELSRHILFNVWARTKNLFQVKSWIWFDDSQI